MAATAVITLSARDMITRALRKLGVVGQGNAANAEDVSAGLDDLNGMIGAWAADRWTVYQLADLSFVGSGAKTYTIGPAQIVNVAERPDRLEGAYLVQLIPAQTQPVSYPMKVLTAYEDYARITLKNLTTFPWVIFYDPGFPNGLLYPWPLPTSAYEIHILVKAILSGFGTLDDLINLPRPYYEAILYNLCIRLGTTYPTGQMSDDIYGLASAALARITASNFALAELRMPSVLHRSGTPFNVYSGFPT